MTANLRALREWNFAVVVVDDKGDVVEVMALADNIDLADAAFQVAPTKRSAGTIQLRNGSRVVRSERTERRLK